MPPIMEAADRLVPGIMKTLPKPMVTAFFNSNIFFFDDVGF
jgi:hypothetical protein